MICTMFADETLLGYLALRKRFILVNGSWQSVNQASVCGFTLEAVGSVGLSLSAPYTSNCWQYKVIVHLWACMLTFQQCGV